MYAFFNGCLFSIVYDTVVHSMCLFQQPHFSISGFNKARSWQADLSFEKWIYQPQENFTAASFRGNNHKPIARRRRLSRLCGRRQNQFLSPSANNAVDCFLLSVFDKKKSRRFEKNRDVEPWHELPYQRLATMKKRRVGATSPFFQVTLQQKRAEIRKRGDRLRFSDIGVGELDPVPDRRVAIRSDQGAQGF